MALLSMARSHVLHILLTAITFGAYNQFSWMFMPPLSVDTERCKITDIKVYFSPPMYTSFAFFFLVLTPCFHTVLNPVHSALHSRAILNTCFIVSSLKESPNALKTILSTGCRKKLFITLSVHVNRVP